jgi:hypothetical protein
MRQAQASTITGFNEFVSKLKEEQNAGEVRLKLIQFDDYYESHFDTELNTVPQLTVESYVPRGSTALHDSMGKAIYELGQELAELPEEKRPGKVIFLTMTDGMHNTTLINETKHYDRETLAAMIKTQEEVYNWLFMYIGANQDAITVGKGLNIPQAFSMTYNVSDPSAVQATYAAAARSMNSVRGASYRGVRGQSVNESAEFTKEERTRSMGGDNGVAGVAVEDNK